MTAGSFWFRLSLGGCRFGGRRQLRRGVRSSADATAAGGSPQQQVCGVVGVPQAGVPGGSTPAGGRLGAVQPALIGGFDL